MTQTLPLKAPACLLPLGRLPQDFHDLQAKILLSVNRCNLVNSVPTRLAPSLTALSTNP